MLSSRAMWLRAPLGMKSPETTPYALRSRKSEAQMRLQT